VKRAVNNKSGDEHIYCNSCGKKLKVENGILKEDAFEATKEWGYFSDWDTQIHHFNLCEECYKKIISGFEIPVEVRKKLEVL
jgi:Fe2+ or Zn2+ uptake regulation protein